MCEAGEGLPGVSLGVLGGAQAWILDLGGVGLNLFSPPSLLGRGIPGLI